MSGVAMLDYCETSSFAGFCTIDFSNEKNVINGLLFTVMCISLPHTVHFSAATKTQKHKKVDGCSFTITSENNE